VQLLGSRLKPRLLGKTAPQLLRSNSLGAVGPEAGARCVGEDWISALLLETLKKLGEAF